MKRFIIINLLFLLLSCGNKTDKSFEIHSLSCEFQKKNAFIEIQQPRLSWKIVSDKKGFKQAAYQLLVASSIEHLENNNADIWNSGKILKDHSTLVKYEGPALKTGEVYFWKVKAWGENDQEAESGISQMANGIRSC